MNITAEAEEKFYDAIIDYIRRLAHESMEILDLWK